MHRRDKQHNALLHNGDILTETDNYCMYSVCLGSAIFKHELSQCYKGYNIARYYCFVRQCYPLKSTCVSVFRNCEDDSNMYKYIYHSDC